MRLPGDWPVVKVKFEIKSRKDQDCNNLPVNQGVEIINPISKSLPMKSLAEEEKSQNKGIKIKLSNLGKIYNS